MAITEGDWQVDDSAPGYVRIIANPDCDREVLTCSAGRSARGGLTRSPASTLPR